MQSLLLLVVLSLLFWELGLKCSVPTQEVVAGPHSLAYFLQWLSKRALYCRLCRRLSTRIEEWPPQSRRRCRRDVVLQGQGNALELDWSPQPMSEPPVPRVHPSARTAPIHGNLEKSGGHTWRNWPPTKPFFKKTSAFAFEQFIVLDVDKKEHGKKWRYSFEN